MAQQQATLNTSSTALIEELHDTLSLKPTTDSQRAAQPEMLKALHNALDARRQRIVLSESGMGTVKWVGIMLQGFCTLLAIAVVHSDNRLACAIASTLFATGLALSMLLVAAYGLPFTGDISVGPDLLQQVQVGNRVVFSLLADRPGNKKDDMEEAGRYSQAFFSLEPESGRVTALGEIPLPDHKACPWSAGGNKIAALRTTADGSREIVIYSK